MHPILFRIPLPHWPLRLWWALVALAAFAALYAALAGRRGDRNGSFGGAVAAVVLVVLAYLFRDTAFEAGSLPIFSYGVMLGLSMIVGWFWTLHLAAKEGLSKDTVANCFLVAAAFALVGARILYVLTNSDQFHSLAEMVNLRRGGYTAYGGFLGGLLGSWVYLRTREVSVMKWGDLVSPSLAIGLALTRIGCWLFGCDFGSRLPKGAPGWLQRLGTFPRWLGATQDAGEGSGPFLRHRDRYRGTPEGVELMHRDLSFPVHPTQIYEALSGLVLLGLVLWMRKRNALRGQVFAILVFGYGVARYVIEFVRDDPDHRTFGPSFSFHVMLACGLGLFALGFALGIARAIADPKRQLAARIGGFVPAVLAFFAFRPAAFAPTVEAQLSVSQWLALITGLVAAYLYGDPPRGAEGDPLLIPIPPARPKSPAPPAPPVEEPEPDDDDEEEEPEPPVPVPAPAKV